MVDPVGGARATRAEAVYRTGRSMTAPDMKDAQAAAKTRGQKRKQTVTVKMRKFSCCVLTWSSYPTLGRYCSVAKLRDGSNEASYVKIFGN